ncbi:hypothetical protein PRSY57_1228600 [Plasmodium reichenowi]|uniref:Uncharacterized protein n=1 Tax=Plasmodium reichenowi TaxID=5854 RepID=A0A151L8X6_PLARE|nr:hypothetical protein PRSY57_1228600 [Plasmodium reichenowi]KYN95398.1 hypothetical protein PRSY57_1228600 [Plasmodium reichenowi]
MKLKYHLFFLIIFIQDILCLKYEDYIKSLPETFHLAKGDSKKDEMRKENSKEENDNNNNNNDNKSNSNSNSNYKVGMQDIVNNISNKISDDNKNKDNNSYDKYDCNDDDNNNTSNSLFHKMMCAFKKKLFKNEQVIEKDIRNVKKGVINLKENVVKDSSNISKHTNILKDDITKNTNYLFNLFKKSLKEEGDNVNKFSSDYFNKLKNLPDSHLFFSKLLLTLNQNDDKDKNKITHINNYYNNNMNDNTENNTNLLQNFLSFIKNVKHKDEYNNDNNIKKENDFFHSFYLHNENDKHNNNKDKKYSWWFTNKNDEKKNVDNHLNLLYNNSNNSFNSTLNQNQTDHENLPEQVREKKNSQEEKNKWLDILWKYFHKNEEEIEKEMNEKKDLNDNNKNGVNVDDHNFNGSHNLDEKKNKFSFLNYWNDKDIPKEGSADEYSHDNNNNKTDDQNNDDNKKFNIFMYFRKNKKNDEDMNKNKKEMNMEMDMDMDMNMNKDMNKDMNMDKNNEMNNEMNKDMNMGDDTNVGMSDTLNNNLNKKEMNKVDEDPKGFVLNLVKNYYENNKNVDNINYSLLLTSDKETNENINYHPLIKFKSCLMNCFNEINNTEKSVEKESYLSLDDYRILEKCISKCKNNNLNDTHNEDPPMKKDDTILYIEKKNKINDTTKNTLLNDNINNLINENNESTEKETSSKWSNFFFKKNNKNIKDSYEENKNSNNPQDNISVLTSNETNLENLNILNDNLSTHLMYDIDNNNNKKKIINNNNNNNNYKMKNFLIDSRFKYSNKEKTKNFIQHEQQDKNKNVYNKPLHFFNYFNNSNINTDDDNNIYKDNLIMNNSANDNLLNNDDKYNSLKNINNNNIILNKNDIDNDENNNYISTGFFLFLLLITFFVYLSAFTNIINQFYLSFKEKICLFIKGKYKGTFDNVYEESCESFLPKVQYKNSHNNNNNDNNNFCQSYENIYHSFQENSLDMA